MSALSAATTNLPSPADSAVGCRLLHRPTRSGSTHIFHRPNRHPRTCSHAPSFLRHSASRGHRPAAAASAAAADDTLPPSWSSIVGAQPRPLLELVAETLAAADADSPTTSGAAHAARFLAKLSTTSNALRQLAGSADLWLPLLSLSFGPDCFAQSKGPLPRGPFMHMAIYKQALELESAPSLFFGVATPRERDAGGARLFDGSNATTSSLPNNRRIIYSETTLLERSRVALWSPTFVLTEDPIDGGCFELLPSQCTRGVANGTRSAAASEVVSIATTPAILSPRSSLVATLKGAKMNKPRKQTYSAPRGESVITVEVLLQAVRDFDAGHSYGGGQPAPLLREVLHELEPVPDSDPPEFVVVWKPQEVPLQHGGEEDEDEDLDDLPPSSANSVALPSAYRVVSELGAGRRSECAVAAFEEARVSSAPTTSRGINRSLPSAPPRPRPRNKIDHWHSRLHDGLIRDHLLPRSARFLNLQGRLLLVAPRSTSTSLPAPLAARYTRRPQLHAACLVTFAASGAPLVSAEVWGALPPPARWLLWRLHLFVDIGLVVLLLPFVLLSLTLRATLGVSSMSARALALVPLAAWLWAFYKVGEPFPIMQDSAATWADWLSGSSAIARIAALCLSRAGVIGVSLSALLSGSGAVNGPATSLHRLMATVDARELDEAKRGVLHALQLLSKHRLRLRAFARRVAAHQRKDAEQGAGRGALVSSIDRQARARLRRLICAALTSLVLCGLARARLSLPLFFRASHARPSSASHGARTPPYAPPYESSSSRLSSFSTTASVLRLL